MDADSVDVRGSQKGILRLYPFDKLALLHMLFYRALIVASFATAAVILYYILSGSAASFIYVQAMVLVVWVLFTPQLFATVKVFSLVSTKGVTSDKLNSEYLETLQQKPVYRLFASLPYAALAVWLIFLVIIILLWF